MADELSGIYEEILVDEYQDSNEVQETLIRCVSRERFRDTECFMVGDVKQSIYKFRLAKPELFWKNMNLTGMRMICTRRSSSIKISGADGRVL